MLLPAEVQSPNSLAATAPSVEKSTLDREVIARSIGTLSARRALEMAGGDLDSSCACVGDWED
jgi:hypothetical protein